MTFAAAMRLGSLEMVAAMLLFAVFALRGTRTTGYGAAAAPADAPLRVELEVSERGRSRRVEGTTPLVIGRSTEADVLVMDPEVSRRHAQLEHDGGTVFLTDLRSSNGTFLNGRQLQESIELRPGDEIGVGQARIIFVGATRGTNDQR